MGPFGVFLKQKLKDHNSSVYALCMKLGKSQGNVGNIIHERPIPNTRGGYYKPPLDEMDAWADAIGLDSDERAQLVELAELAHTPPAIRDRYLTMKAQLSEPQRHAASATETYAADRRELDMLTNPDDYPAQPAPTYPRPAPIRGGSDG